MQPSWAAGAQLAIMQVARWLIHTVRWHLTLIEALLPPGDDMQSKDERGWAVLRGRHTVWIKQQHTATTTNTAEALRHQCLLQQIPCYGQLCSHCL